MKNLFILFLVLSSNLFARELDYSLFGKGNIPKMNLDFPENKGEYNLGTGFNTFTGKTAGTCITFKENPRNLGSGRDVKLETVLITNQTDLYKSLNIEASASVRFGFLTLSPKVKFANETIISNYAFYVLAKIEVTSPEISILPESLTPNTKEFLINKETFLNGCGDEFVKGINLGASLYAVFEIKGRTAEERKNLLAELGGDFGIFSTELNFTHSLKNILKNRKAKFNFIQSGGPIGAKFKNELALPQDEDEVITYIATFASKVNEDNMVPQKARTASFNEIIPIDFFSSPQILHQFDVLNYLQKKRVHYLHALANIEYIIRNYKSSVSIEDLSTLFKEREKTISFLNKTAEYASNCTEMPKSCFFPTDLIEVDSQPSIELASPICEFKEANICGVLSSELKTDGPACGYSTENIPHESCGVETYKIGEAEECRKLDPDSKDLISKETIYKMGIGPQCGVALYNERKSGSVCGYKNCFGLIKKCRERTCRHPNFGVEKYNTCRHEDFKVERYPLCRDKGFGVESYKKCPVNFPKTCEIKKFKTCWVTFSEFTKENELCPLFAIPRSTQ